ncbi:MAG: hypothetical protein KJ697_01990 [Nanoarchaeota archaeon]|nr:hypothetical protein [Nanoarchaeota archaeon]MBU4124455.1 hypothetical protein [Nanoarchaeota archaeon]
MKGVSVLIAFVLVIVISVAALTIALNIGNPTIEKSKEIIILNEGKSNLKIIDSTINQVLQEGDGSSRRLSISVSGGTYNIKNNRLEFVMDTKYQIVSETFSNETVTDVPYKVIEDGLTVEATAGKILVYIEYKFDFVNTARLERGTNSILISNKDGDIQIN